MMDPYSEPGVYFIVHHPFETANPLMMGMFLKIGKTYSLKVKMVSSYSSYLDKTTILEKIIL